MAEILSLSQERPVLPCSPSLFLHARSRQPYAEVHLAGLPMLLEGLCAENILPIHLPLALPFFPAFAYNSYL